MPTRIVLWLLLPATCLTWPIVASQRAAATPSVHELLAAYWKGEFDVVAKRFASGQEVATLLPGARAWAQTSRARPWEFGSIVLFLELADAAVRLPNPSPEASQELLQLGYEELTDRRRRSAQPEILPALEVQWHSAALAILQGARNWAAQQKYLNQVGERFPNNPPARFAMAAGIAIEQRYASAGPVATAAREARAADDRERAAESAAREFDRAARDPALRAEASARAAAAYLRISRHRDALRRLDLAGTSGEVLIASWLAHLRGQVLDGLGETADAAGAFENARQMTRTAGDEPWRELERGDFRQVPGWIASLKGGVATRTADRKASVMPAAVVLERYSKGEWDVVGTALSEARSLAQFSKDFRAFAQAWAADSAGPEESARRMTVAATLALEAAQARGLAEWGEAQLLIEFACEWLRSVKQPTEFERLWYHASVALMEGAAGTGGLGLHVPHALRRFPHDPAIIMARGVASELSAGPILRTSDGKPADVPAVLDRAEPLLKEAAALDAYRHEANLRLGAIALRRDLPKDALVRFKAALDGAEESYIVHLAHLLSGRAHARLNQWKEAAAAYRSAIDVIPTQTSRIALVHALSRLGDFGGASTLADESLTEADPNRDPWLSYGQGDFRHWAVLIERLRRGMR